MEALQCSSHFSVNRVPCTQNWTGNRRSRATFSSAFTGTSNSASLSSKNPSTREIWSWVKSKTVNHGRYRRSQVRAEMFGQLTGGLEAPWSKLKGEEVLTKENIAEPMRDIRRALLEADVSLPVVRRFVQSVSDQAVGMGVIRGVKPDQQLVKIVHDELVKLMGGEVSELQFAKSGPTVILLAGLQGVGKTTVCAKLACYLKKQGKSCMLIAGDVYRPAAIDQLVILGEQVSVPVYTAGTDVKPAEIAKQGLKEAKKNNIDVVIMDTAGRLQIDKGMMDELKDVKKFLNPTETLLVVDAMTGQEAAALVTTFNVEIGITGAILTKLDGDSRGGAALSVKEVSGKPIKLVGRGERMEDLEPFYPDRMAGRILGMGDVLSFVEKATEVMRQEDAEDLQKKIMSAKFDFNDFLKQTRAVAKMGSMTRVLGMIPGMGKVSPAQIREAEKNLLVMEAMIEVMTPEEREKPELLAESPERRKRIAKDSGKTEQQVSALVAQIFQMRVKMKNLMGVMEGGSIPALSGLEDALKAEQKAPPGTARRKRKAESRKKFVESSSSKPGPRGFGSGIYVGDDRVIHFTRRGQEVGTGTVLDLILVSSGPSRNHTHCPTCGPPNEGHGVVSSCLNCFLAGGVLYRFEYSVNAAHFLAKARGGTCTLAIADPNEIVVHRAKHLLQNGFGCYDVFKNNCEDFAIYCKTGLLVLEGRTMGQSGQAVSIIGGPIAAVLSTPMRLVTTNVYGMAATAIGVYCASRYATDIGMRADVVKVGAEDLTRRLSSGLLQVIEPPLAAIALPSTS